MPLAEAARQPGSDPSNGGNVHGPILNVGGALVTPRSIMPLVEHAVSLITLVGSMLADCWLVGHRPPAQSYPSHAGPPQVGTQLLGW